MLSIEKSERERDHFELRLFKLSAMFEVYEAPNAEDDGYSRQHVLLSRSPVFWHSELIVRFHRKFDRAHCQKILTVGFVFLRAM
jgi:hypothetical protein